MNVEPSRPARPRRTRRSARHLAVAGMLTISIAACSSNDLDTPTAAETAAPTVPSTATARIETPSSTVAPARPAVTQPPNSSASATIAPLSATNPEVATPLVSVRGSQTNGADVELFRVTTDEPMYWRVTALPVFDGRTWGIPESELLPIDDTVDPPPGGRTVRQQLEILGLKGRLVPAAADPMQVATNTDIRFNADTSTLVTLSELATGDRFTIVSKAPNVTLDELRAASTENPPDDLVLEVPDDLPGVVSELATEVTAGVATTDYDRLIALQNWFRNEFTYDLTVAASDDPTETFLQTRRGYCEQFASTFAVMARTLGIPSRVAVGFTPGQLNADGSYSVFGKNAHAWPEVWFNGIGWVPFEPTPPQGAIPGLEDLPNG